MTRKSRFIELLRRSGAARTIWSRSPRRLSMLEIETDYLVVGAGASGMAFTDALIAASDHEVVMVDRRDRPGGHWNDDYSFVRLHQPSALYGVSSRTLGQDRIDEWGINAGFYERATAAEICDYYGRVLDEQFLPSGQVRVFGMHDYLGADAEGHLLRSRVTGETTTVRVRRKLVDATYIESSLPSTHTPAYTTDGAAVVVTPNELPGMDEPASGFTVIGAGKTAMDTCCWLIEHGVDPDAIRWIRPRDAWTADRSAVQPLRLVGAFVEWVAAQNEECARAATLDDLFPALEDRGVLYRLDPGVEPVFNRGAILCEAERSMLREVGNVVRLGKVQHVGVHGIDLDEGTIPSQPGHVVVDCTAAGLASPPDRRIYDPDRITLQWIQAGIAPFSAALTGFVEASREDDTDKNRLCRARGFSRRADVVNYAAGWLNTQRGFLSWMAEPDLAEWLSTCRLSAFGNAGPYLDDPATQAALGRMIGAQGPAVENLQRLLADVEPVTTV
jgi:NAD(P)-binding Rossmann-like domain